MTKETSGRIFIVTHKTIEAPIMEPGYSYIGVSEKAKNCEFYDSTGDNISIKNPNYCELTALYWIWKNTKCDYVGLVHYRRFFCNAQNGEYKPISIYELNTLAGDDCVVIPKVIPSQFSILDSYEMFHKNNALRTCCDFIKEKDCSYSDTIDAFLRGKKISCYNMFYCKKDIIDRYCEWLFSIL